jgi:hypothetical protein
LRETAREFLASRELEPFAPRVGSPKLEASIQNVRSCGQHHHVELASFEQLPGDVGPADDEKAAGVGIRDSINNGRHVTGY